MTCPPILVNEVTHRSPCPSFSYTDAMPPVIVDVFVGVFIILGIVSVLCFLILMLTFIATGRD